MDHLVGIFTGLLAAFFQSLSYIATRHFVQRRPPGKRGGASRSLLILSHIWMGLFACVLVPLAWPANGLDFKTILYPLIMTPILYLAGQVGLIMALKHIEPSRVSPLLGFKIVILAVLTISLPALNSGGNTVTPLQWGGCALCVIAAVGLNFSGTRLNRPAVFAIAFACVAYSFSDWHITMLVIGIKQNARCSDIRAALFAAGLVYIACGLFALPFLIHFGVPAKRDWRGALPFSLAWFAGMLLLYACFGLLGPLFGNILQSTRGLMSIALSTLLIRLGHLHLEPDSGRSIFLRRLASGTLMFLAVTLYVFGTPSKPPPIPTSAPTTK